MEAGGKMRKVLFILSEFKDQDIDWITGAGVKELCKEGQVLIQQGRRTKELFIVLQGRFNVVVDGNVIAELSPGEIVGELSFLDSRPPNASVIAQDNSMVLAISGERLTNKLRTDTGFASRFYRGLGIMLATRLRDTVGQLAYGKERQLQDDVEETGELPVEMLESISIAAARFDDILDRMARQ